MAAENKGVDARFEVLRAFLGLVKGGSVAPVWVPDGSAFTFLDRSSEPAIWRRVDVATGVAVPTEDHPPTETPPADAEVALRMAPQMVRPGFGASAVGPTRQFEVPSPDGKRLLSLSGHDLALRDPISDRTEQITDDGEEAHPWCLTVNNLLGDGNARWAPDGRRFAAFRLDLRHIEPIPVVYHLPAVPRVETYRIATVSDRMYGFELYLGEAESHELRRVDTGDGEHVPFIVGFIDGGDALLVLKQDRWARRVELLRVDTAGGDVTTLLTEERLETFVADGADLFFRGFGVNPTSVPFLLPDLTAKIKVLSDNRFLWISERSGYRHLYLHGADGTEIRQLTEGDWPVAHVDLVDEEAGVVYFTAASDTDRAYDLHVHRVGLDGAGQIRLTEGDGAHTASFSPDVEVFVDNWSSPTTPPQSALRRTDGTFISALAEADVSAIEATGRLPVEEVKVKADDGITDLYAQVLRPLDFDERQCYPVVQVGYGAGYMSVYPRGFGSWYYGDFDALTADGFVVVRTDPRGTPGRSKAFRDAAYGKVGTVDIHDAAQVIRAIAADRPWMDLDRVAFVGGSYGGYATIRALLLEPDLYKVGFAMIPADLGVNSTQMICDAYMGPPAENPAGWDAVPAGPLAGNLKGHLELVATTADLNALFDWSMKLSDAFFRAGKHIDMAVLPDRDHALSAAGEPGVGGWLLDRLRRYLRLHLSPSS